MTELDTRATVAAMLEAAAARDTGCLVISDGTGRRSGRIYLRDGDVYSVRVEGFLPRLAHRLRAGGMIDAEELRALLHQCNGDPHALDAGEKAVASGMVDLEVLHALHRELLLSSIGAMRTWERPRIEVRRWEQTDVLTVPPISVPTVLRALDRRQERWQILWAGLAAGAPVHSVYPRRRDTGRVPPGERASFEAEAVLAAADGTRSLDEVAAECGLTHLEMGHALAPLVAAGLVEISLERAMEPAGRGRARAPVDQSAIDHQRLERDPRPSRDLAHDARTRGPRLAPDVIAANEHLDVLVEPSDVEEDLPTWGDPVDSLPDGIYLQPIAIDMPEVVFEALADGLTNRTTSVPDVAPVLDEPMPRSSEQRGDQHHAGAAGEAERIAADEAVRVQAEEDAARRTDRQAALHRALAALDAAQAEVERAEVACEELLTTRVRVEATVSRLAEAVTASDDELSRLDTEARASAELAERGATDEEQARAEVAAAEAAVSRAAAALQAAREAQEAAVSRLVATGASRADLYERAAAAQAQHCDAAERSARLRAEERLARDDAAVSVRAHAAAQAVAAAARESVAEAARRLEGARSRLSEIG